MDSRISRKMVGIMLIIALFGTATATISMAQENITLSPLTAINPIGTNHTVIAKVTLNGQPFANQPVAFGVISGPNSPLNSTILRTNTTGQVSFTYSDKKGGGIDTIQAATQNPVGTIILSNKVTKTWVAPSHNVTITLSPLTATNPVGTTHTVIANVSDNGTPLTNQQVGFGILSGPNSPFNSTNFTNATGQASFTYFDRNGAGTDTIEAATINPFTKVTIFSNNVTKTWVNPVTNGSMIGAGSIFSGKTFVIYGFDLQCDKNNNPNNLGVEWNFNMFQLKTLAEGLCWKTNTGFDYQGSGVGRYNGVDGATASWKFTDAGLSGINDTATVLIKDIGGNTVLSVSGDIKGIIKYISS